MNKRIVLLGVLCFCVAGLASSIAILKQKTHAASRSVLSGIPMGDSHNSPLKAEIELVQTVIKNHEKFSVSTALRNKGSDVWILEILACGYSNQWTSDNPSIVIGESCLNNYFQRIGLKPGEVFKKTIRASVELAPGTGQSESVTFRLGFKDPNFSANPTNPPMKNSPIWSNAVTVGVAR